MWETTLLATKLASAINSAAGSIVTASANGTSVQLVSTGTGLGVNYAVSVSIADTQTASYPTLFPSPSFTASAANMSGGGAPGPNYGVIYSYMIPQGGYAPNGRGPREQVFVRGVERQYTGSYGFGDGRLALQLRCGGPADGGGGGDSRAQRLSGAERRLEL